MLSTYLYGFFTGDFPRCQRFHSFEKRQPLPRPPHPGFAPVPGSQRYWGSRASDTGGGIEMASSEGRNPGCWLKQPWLVSWNMLKLSLAESTDNSCLTLLTDPSSTCSTARNVSDTVQETKFSSLVTMFRFGCRLAALSRSVHMTLFRLSRLLKLRSYVFCWAKDRHSWSYLRLGLNKHLSVFYCHANVDTALILFSHIAPKAAWHFGLREISMKLVVKAWWRKTERCRVCRIM